MAAARAFLAESVSCVHAGVQKSRSSFACEEQEDVDVTGLCLWAVGISLTHPSSGELMNLSIEEPALFEAVRAREFELWRSTT